MDKSLVVIDTPQDCCNCMFCYELDEGIKALCVLVDDEERNMKEIDVNYCEEKPLWCPLKPMPNKKDDAIGTNYQRFVQGWNDCIDAITKER